MGAIIPLSFSILLLLAVSNPSLASKDCGFPAIFNLGDSNSDTGGLSASFTPAPWPHGVSYFHMPAGRYSDGRLIIDFFDAKGSDPVSTESTEDEWKTIAYEKTPNINDKASLM